jgi:hypothetical protein
MGGWVKRGASLRIERFFLMDFFVSGKAALEILIHPSTHPPYG